MSYYLREILDITRGGVINTTGIRARTGVFANANTVTAAVSETVTANLVDTNRLIVRGQTAGSGGFAADSIDVANAIFGNVQVTGGITALGSNAISFRWLSVANFPPAASHEGSFAYAEDTGIMYYARDGAWLEVSSAQVGAQVQGSAASYLYIGTFGGEDTVDLTIRVGQRLARAVISKASGAGPPALSSVVSPTPESMPAFTLYSQPMADTYRVWVLGGGTGGEIVEALASTRAVYQNEGLGFSATQPANTTAILLGVSTAGARLGIGLRDPTQALDVVGNVRASGTVVATALTGNLSGGSVTLTGALAAAAVTASGNVEASNVRASGKISALLGFTGGLTGDVLGNVTAAGNIVAAGNVNAANMRVTSVVTAASFVGPLTGNVTAQGNVNAANVRATDTVTAATLRGNLVATGNVDAGNVIAVANVHAANVRATDTVSATTLQGNLVAENVTLSGNLSVANVAVTPAELGYLGGVSSAIQTQLAAKANTANPSANTLVIQPSTNLRDFVNTHAVTWHSDSSAQLTVNGLYLNDVIDTAADGGGQHVAYTGVPGRPLTLVIQPYSGMPILPKGWQGTASWVVAKSYHPSSATNDGVELQTSLDGSYWTTVATYRPATTSTVFDGSYTFGAQLERDTYLRLRMKASYSASITPNIKFYSLSVSSHPLEFRGIVERQLALSVPVHLFVSPAGSDANAGTVADPLQTLTAARDKARTLRSAGNPIVVNIRQGVYTTPLALTEADSGVTFLAFNGEKVVLSPGRFLSAADFVPIDAVTHAAVYAKLSPAIRSSVLVASVPGLDLADGAWGFNVQGVRPRPRLFVDGELCDLCRYPKKSTPYTEWPRLASVVTASGAGQAFTYDSAFTRPTTWSASDDVWVTGLPTKSWAVVHSRAILNAGTSTVTLATPYTVYSLEGPTTNYAQWMYFENVAEELVDPGEYHIDVVNNLVYLIPPTSWTAASEIAFTNDTAAGVAMVTVTDAADVTLRGLTCAHSTSPLISVVRGTNITIAECALTNSNERGVSVYGIDCSVEACSFRNLGTSGASIAGGNLGRLVFAGNNKIQGCTVDECGVFNGAYNCGFALSGVRNIIRNNRFLRAQGQFITWSAIPGNHGALIENNEFYDASAIFLDGGAIYGGAYEDPRWLDNTIRYNVFRCKGLSADLHTFGLQKPCVYLDYLGGGWTVCENVFHGAKDAVLVNGGHRNAIRDNYFVECRVAINFTEPTSSINSSVLPSLRTKWQAVWDLVLSQPSFAASELAAAFPHLLTLLANGQTITTLPTTFTLRVENNVANSSRSAFAFLAQGSTVTGLPYLKSKGNVLEPDSTACMTLASQRLSMSIPFLVERFGGKTLMTFSNNPTQYVYLGTYGQGSGYTEVAGTVDIEIRDTGNSRFAVSRYTVVKSYNVVPVVATALTPGNSSTPQYTFFAEMVGVNAYRLWVFGGGFVSTSGGAEYKISTAGIFKNEALGSSATQPAGTTLLGIGLTTAGTKVGINLPANTQLVSTLQVHGTANVTTSLQVSGATSTAAAPTLTLTDAQTGLFRPEANVLAVSTAAAERLRVTATGNVGIGTIAPTAKLHVAGNVAVDGALMKSNWFRGNAATQNTTTADLGTLPDLVMASPAEREAAASSLLARPGPTGATAWTDMVWAEGAGLFVAVGTGAVVATSPNGIVWTTRAVTNSQWNTVVYSAERREFVALAVGTGPRAMVSTDGAVTWVTGTTANDTALWASIAWAPSLNLYAAVAASGSTLVMTSPDAQTWTAVSGVTATGWQRLVWADTFGMFIAVGFGTGFLMTSSNGTTWTTRAMAASLTWRSLAFAPELGMAVAVAQTGVGSRVATTKDGITWTLRATPEQDWRAVAWSGSLGTFLAFARDGATRAMSSADGINWVTRASGDDAALWHRVVWARGLSIFCALSNTGNVVATSRPLLPTSKTTIVMNPAFFSANAQTGGVAFGGDVAAKSLQVTSTTATAAAPALTLTDAQSGLFRPAANVVAISTASTERLRVSATGNVGIGTQDPSAKLHVAGTFRADDTITAPSAVIANVTSTTMQVSSITTDQLQITEGGGVAIAGAFTLRADVATGLTVDGDVYQYNGNIYGQGAGITGFKERQNPNMEGRLAEYANSARRLYVSTTGSDANHGKSRDKALRTIKKAAALAVFGTVIWVEAGVYTENNPIYIPSNVAVLGDSLRNTLLLAANPRLDYFHCANMNYFSQLRFIDLRAPGYCCAFPCALTAVEVVAQGITAPGDRLMTSTRVPILFSPEAPTGYYLANQPPLPEDADLVEAAIAGLVEGFALVVANGVNTPFPDGALRNAGGYRRASDLLLANKALLQAKVLAWVVLQPFYAAYTPEQQVALVATCSRDVGYIVDGLAADLVAGSYLTTLEYAGRYFEGAVSVLPPDQRTPTIDAIRQLGYADPLNPPAGPAYAIKVATETAIAIAEPGLPQLYFGVQSSEDSVAPGETMASAIARLESLLDGFAAVVASPSAQFGAAAASLVRGAGQSRIADVIDARASSLKTKVIAWTEDAANGVTLGPDNKARCARDVGFILEAVAYDLRNGSFLRSREYALKYYRGSGLSYLPPGQVTPTVNAILYLKSQIVVAALAATAAGNMFDGNPSTTYESLLAYRNLNGSTDAVGATITVELPGPKMYVGYRVKRANLKKWRLEARETPTSAWTTVHEVDGVQAAVTDATGAALETEEAVLRASALFQGMAVVIEDLGNEAAWSQAAFENAGGFTTAASLLLANKSFLQAEVVAWVVVQQFYVALTGDQKLALQDKCTRDVGFLVDAVVGDLRVGGFSRSQEAALAYYNGAVSRLVTPGTVTPTADAVRRLGVLAASCIRNVAPADGESLQSAVFQAFDDAASSDVGVTYGTTALAGYSFYRLVMLQSQGSLNTFRVGNLEFLEMDLPDAYVDGPNTLYTVIDSFDVEDGGSGYDPLAPPTVTVLNADGTSPVASGGEQAQATAVIVDGAVARVRLNLKTFSSVQSLQITNGGAGYTAAPTVVFGVGTATRVARALSWIDKTGRVVRVEVLDGGAGYSAAPSAIFVPTNGTSPTTPATAVASMQGTRDPGREWSLARGKKYEGGAATVTVSAPSGVGGVTARVVAIMADDYADLGVPVYDPTDGDGELRRNVDERGRLRALKIRHRGYGYYDTPAENPPFVSVLAPTAIRPFITGSPYVQNCSNITGPFDTDGEKVPVTWPLPWNPSNIYNVPGPNVGYDPAKPSNPAKGVRTLDNYGSGGGIRIDGRCPLPLSPLRSFVVDAFTQVSQCGIGFFLTNLAYSQFVSTFGTFCTIHALATGGSFGNFSNSVTDFGRYGLLARGYYRVPYLKATVLPIPEADLVSFDKTYIRTFNSKPYYGSQLATVTFLTAGKGYVTIPGSPGFPTVTIAPPWVVDQQRDQEQAQASVAIDVSTSILKELNLNPDFQGKGYRSVPAVAIQPPSGYNPELTQPGIVPAVGEAVLRGVPMIRVRITGGLPLRFANNRKPDTLSIVRIHGKFYTVQGASLVTDAVDSDTYDVAFGGTEGAPPYVDVGHNIAFFQVSYLSTGGHVFEYVGDLERGGTYNSLPEYGGIPSSANEIKYELPAKVFFTASDHLGNQRVGEFFSINQATGSVKLDAKNFDLTRISSLGPFLRDGVAQGVVMREVSANEGLKASTGAADPSTVPTQSAVKTYVDKRAVPIDGVGIVDGAFLRWNNGVSQKYEWASAVAEDLGVISVVLRADVINGLVADGDAKIFGNLTVDSLITEVGLQTPQMALQAGTEVAPALTVGSAQGGVFGPAANVVAISTAGGERMRVTPAGDVGIGTLAPSAKLHVAGNAAIDGSVIVSGNLSSTGAINGVAPLELAYLAGIRTPATFVAKFIDVTAYGLKGDGSIDNTPLLQQLIDDIPAGFPDYFTISLLFPRGNFRFGSPVVLKHLSTTIRGSGMHTTTLRITDQSPTTNFISSSFFDSTYGQKCTVEIYDLSLRSTGTGREGTADPTNPYVTGALLDLSNAILLSMRNVFVEAWDRIGIRLTGVSFLVMTHVQVDNYTNTCLVKHGGSGDFVNCLFRQRSVAFDSAAGVGIGGSTRGPCVYMSGETPGMVFAGNRLGGGGPKYISKVASIVVGGTTATLTTVQAHMLQVGDLVLLSGTGVAAYDWKGFTVVSVPTSTTLTFGVLAGTAGTSTGLATSRHVSLLIDNEPKSASGAFNESMFANNMFEAQTGSEDVKLNKSPGSCSVLIDATQGPREMAGNQFTANYYDFGAIGLYARSGTGTSSQVRGLSIVGGSFQSYEAAVRLAGCRHVVISGIQTNGQGDFFGATSPPGHAALLVDDTYSSVLTRGLTVYGCNLGAPRSHDPAGGPYNEFDHAIKLITPGGMTDITVSDNELVGNVSVFVQENGQLAASARVVVHHNRQYILGNPTVVLSRPAAAVVDVGLSDHVEITSTGTPVTTLQPAWYGRELVVIARGGSVAIGGSVTLASGVPQKLFYDGTAWLSM